MRRSFRSLHSIVCILSNGYTSIASDPSGSKPLTSAGTGAGPTPNHGFISVGAKSAAVSDPSSRAAGDRTSEPLRIIPLVRQQSGWGTVPDPSPAWKAAVTGKVSQSIHGSIPCGRSFLRHPAQTGSAIDRPNRVSAARNARIVEHNRHPRCRSTVCRGSEKRYFPVR